MDEAAAERPDASDLGDAPAPAPAAGRGSFLPPAIEEGDGDGDGGDRTSRDFDWSSHSIPDREATPPPPPPSARRRPTQRQSSHDTAAMDDLKKSIKDKGSSASLSLTVRSLLTAHSSHGPGVDQGGGSGDGGVSGESEAEDSLGLDPYALALRKALEGACSDAFGIVGADVWLHSEEDGGFDHAPGGLFVSPVHRRSSTLSRAAAVALARVEDPTRPDFVPPSRQVAGAGLAGYFWTYCTADDRQCTWRDTRAIVEDPDQPPYPRMRALVEAGFGKATGVPFDCRGHRGIVLFFARESADQRQLSELANDVHLRVSGDLIGAVSAASVTSIAAAEAKQDRTARTLRRIRAKFLASIVLTHWAKERVTDAMEEGRWAPPKPEVDDDDAHAAVKFGKPSFYKRMSTDFKTRMSKTYRRSATEYLVNALAAKARLFAKKSRGGNVQPPPPMPTAQAVWTFVGAFLSMLTLSSIDSALRANHGRSFPLGPFGALLTLQYGLTPAPASQPRNALYGQAVGLSLALLVGLFAPEGSWFRLPLTIALVVAMMCKLGITHPPAGAAAVVFASNDRLDLLTLILMIFGNVVAISIAILVNNLNDKKQYPIYWAFIDQRTKASFAKRLEPLEAFLERAKVARRDRTKNELDGDTAENFLDASVRMSRRDLTRHQRSFRH